MYLYKNNLHPEFQMIKLTPLPQVDELFDENSNLEEENTSLVGRAERADIQNAQLKEQLDEALAKVCACKYLRQQSSVSRHYLSKQAIEQLDS